MPALCADYRRRPADTEEMGDPVQRGANDRLDHPGGISSVMDVLITAP